MTHNQVTINSPRPDKRGYNERTSSLGNNEPFELPYGRWGLKLNDGAVIFGNSVSVAVTWRQLSERDDLGLCRVLPGRVEITYKPEGSVTMNKDGTAVYVVGVPGKITVEDLEAIVRAGVERNHVKQQIRDHQQAGRGMSHGEIESIVRSHLDARKQRGLPCGLVDENAIRNSIVKLDQRQRCNA